MSNAAIYLDRRVFSLGLGSDYSGGVTTWTLPYAVDPNGADGSVVVMKLSPTVRALTVTRPAADQVAVSGEGDLTSAECIIGLSYTSRVVPSKLLLRRTNGDLDPTGRLTVRRLEVVCRDTRDLLATVQVDGRLPYVLTKHPDHSVFSIRLGATADALVVSLDTSSPTGATIAALSWEGTYTSRSKRL